MYIFARYQPPLPPDTADVIATDGPAQIQAMDEYGNLWALTEDSLVGDWIAFLAEGGTIEPYDTPLPEVTPPVVPDAPPPPPNPGGMT